MCDSCGCGGHGTVVEVNQSLLAANEARARENRRHIEALGAVAVNLMSAPGSGKTTLLEHTVEALGGRCRIAVIEGDIETERDAERIRAKGVPVAGLTTGGACHLDAPLVHEGLHRLAEEIGSRGLDLLFIENVGNLVCPAAFDLGEHRRVVLVSVPEGSDKPAKYPAAFRRADLFVVSKADLLPHFDFSLEEARTSARALNPGIRMLTVSVADGRGFDAWIDWLTSLVHGRRG
ncbi:hydrogenase nickel incorporation protein HypB [Dissulfurirhabdus thermomarina]|uniref:Hydrogenase nickel incorporation protein HypB n=1 Tax=Dissulfurirhabdus thermomarina TaxID=1765737 RepID=A0A6N9TVT7_DISTH|nr:hydrogenase nickel incorporation protein HypB [Dissulfurirhabdus thermomarina]NDY42596.1 hydrogenase nickel incorporation protein HypB [Dissulfurirhabdus thermomarina]NMX22659.1 hydrogenase nickel incorporation protein HypB [Dissulfurirhabdus thermomarina]